MGRPAVGEPHRLEQVEGVGAPQVTEQAQLHHPLEPAENVVVPVQRVVQLGELGPDERAGARPVRQPSAKQHLGRLPGGAACLRRPVHPKAAHRQQRLEER
jgi:hypothetical protein